MSKEIQDAKNYICIRVQLIRVKKTWLGYKDEIISCKTVIPDTEKLTIKLYKKLIQLFEILIEKYMPNSIILRGNKK